MDKIDKLWEIADRYNGSKPLSGDWNTETEHQLNATAKELGISKQEAKDLMIKELGFPEEEFEGINCSLDKVEPVTPPRSIPHELPPHNNEVVKQEKKYGTDENGKTFKDYLEEARKKVNSSFTPEQIKEELAGYGIDSEPFIDIEFDINGEDISAFANSWYYNMMGDPKDIKKVEYDSLVDGTDEKLYNSDEEHNFDGAYIITYKDGSTRRYGWYYGHDDLIRLADEINSSRQIKSSLPRTTKELADWINKNSVRKVKYREPFDDFVFDDDGANFYVDKGKVIMDGNGYTEDYPISEYMKWVEEETSSIKSARYIATDPQSGEVLGSADTYEEAVNEWGEDVTITDSEVAEGEENMDTGLFSNKKVIKSGTNNFGFNSEVYGYKFPLVGFVVENEEENDPEGIMTQEAVEQAKELADQMDVGLYENYSEPSLSGEPFLIEFEPGYYEGVCIKVKEGQADVYNEETGDYEDMSDAEMNTYAGKINSYFRTLREQYGWDNFVTDGVGSHRVTSSKTPKGDKAFLSNIVSSVSIKEMTEEQAVKRIALRNNCNEGFARNILSEALKDPTLIQSGVMAIADDLNKDFDLDGNIESWTSDYMEKSGKSTTLGGEILRAFNRIDYRYYNDGDMIGRGYGKETVNPAARFLVEKCVGWTEIPNIEDMLNGESDINKSDDTYNEWLEDLKYSLEDYLRNHEEFFHTPNKDDMLEYRTDDDRDTSVTECYIEDSDGNTYWFENDGSGDWKCYQIDFGTDAEFEVGDVVDSSQIEQYADIDEDSDYVDFANDGLYYSAERYEGDEWEITNIELESGFANEGDIFGIDDLLRYGPYDSNGNELSENDLY